MADPITPPELYASRRAIMRGGLVAAGALATGWLYRRLNGVDLATTETIALPSVVKSTDPRFVTSEAMTPYASITNYNNFYEFTTDKDGVAAASRNFDTRGWTIEIGGLCHAPRTVDLDQLSAIAPVEERVYRLRCVEAWSMVIPWAGVPLAKVLDSVRPMASAKYVAFETLLDPERMPGQTEDVLE